MAFISKTEVANIRQKLKTVAEKYGIKLTVSGANSLSVNCTIRQGKIDFIKDYNDLLESKNRFDGLSSHISTNYMQVNHYWLESHHSGKALECLNEILDCLKSQDYYDNSDNMTDYFDTAYYMHINIGTWDKPYVLIK